MTEHRTTPRLRWLGAAVTLMVMTGCTANELTDKPTNWLGNIITAGKWKQIPRAAGNTVEVVTIEHAVAFNGGETTISPLGKRQITQFLRQTNVSGSDRVMLYGPRRDFGSHDPVTSKRLEVLQAELAQQGVVSSVPAEERLIAADPEAIAILITRAVVIAPECAQPAPGRGARPDFVVGCANSANFGQMVYDPLDIEHGRGMGPADGEARALAIQRYREGEINELEESEIDTTGEQ